MHDHARRPRTLMLPPAPYAAAMLGGWWLDRHVQALPLELGTANRPLSLVLLTLGLGLMAWTFLTFLKHRTTVNPYRGANTLCTGGPFGFSRNPIYLGDWLILAGAALWMTSLWPLIFAPLIWLILRYGVIRHEEAHLEARFGAEYREYRQRVRRWI